jgi:RloB-like protein
MGRERREFVRRSGFRDATLFVIASEGAVTEPRYFNGLKARWHNPRIQIEILTRDDPTLSSPEHVLKTLDHFASEYRLREGDQLWLLIDRDSHSWKPRTMATVGKECERKAYHLAVSHPCFELWLLLHFEDVPNGSPARIQELTENKDGLLKSAVAKHCASKRDYIDHFLPHTENAIARAEDLDKKTRERWPSQLGTRVYRLVTQLMPEQDDPSHIATHGT